MQDLEFSRQQMIEQQLRAWGVSDPRVLCVFDELQREAFVPARFHNLAFADTGIPLGHGETMMTPKVEGRMLQAVTICPTDRILEIGTGSGWITALLATLGAEVHSLDIVPEFTAAARQKLESAGIRNIVLETRDAMTLDSAEGGYDVIVLTASIPVLDGRFERAVAPGGRMFAVVGEAPVMEATLVERTAQGDLYTSSLFETVLPMLRNFPTPRHFAL